MSINRSCLESNEFKDRNAFGCDTKACGQCSLSCGRETKAKGKGSFAKGYKTISFGDYSHSEGLLTESKGTSSHAEGTKLTSIDKFLKSFISNKEDIDGRTGGKKTIAIGTASHAEGAGTESSGNYSHSEGGATQSVGSCSHAEGLGSKAVGIASHAEGDPTLAIGNFSHAEGRETTSLGTASHSEGWNSISEGAYSHAEGVTTIARGNGSHSQGYNTIAGGKYSHSQGMMTQANGMASYSSGENIVVDGDYSYGIGRDCIVSGDNSFVVNNLTPGSTVTISDSNIAYIDSDLTLINPTSTGNVLINYENENSIEKLQIDGNTYTRSVRIIDDDHDGSSSSFEKIALAYYARKDNVPRQFDSLDFNPSSSISFIDRPGTQGPFFNVIRTSDITFNTAENIFTNGSYQYIIQERMRIKAEGRVGINTDSPTEILDVNGDVRIRDNLEVENDMTVNNSNIIINDGIISINSLNTLIGELEFRRSTLTASVKGIYDGSNSTYLTFETRLNTDPSAFEKMRIQPNGDIGIGTGSPNEKLEVNGNVLANNVSVPSDERIKKNIKNLDDEETLDVINKLKPKKYKYENVYNSSDHEVYGFIAQEFKEVIDYAVKVYPEKIFKTEDYQNMINEIKNNEELTREEKIEKIKKINEEKRLKLENFHTMKKDVMFPLLVKNCQILNNKVDKLEEQNKILQKELLDIKELLSNR